MSHFVAVQEDITEATRAAAQIALLNERLCARAVELEDANRDLEAFSYTVSHDLRTPLTAINGYCQLILELFGAGLDERCKEFLGIIYSETTTMADLIRTQLDFSRLNRAGMSRARIDLSELANEAVARLKLREPRRGITFQIAPGIIGDGDPDLVRVVLDNLLDNACKYTGKKEDALIEFGEDGSAGERVFFVRDNGAGFDMALSGRLFGAFQRLHSAQEFSGFGIGLATVERIIRRHGGRVWAEGAVGNGATFHFTLPDAAPA